MELLDRYLEAVRRHLPWKRQDDILAELRANLEAQLEDREAGLGRPLTQGESEDWLRSLGAPVRMAARYQPQQALIGPRLFPVYLAVMRKGMPWLIAIYVVVWAVQTTLNAVGVTKNEPAVALFGLPWSIFVTAAIITGIFALVEFLTLHFPEKFPQLAGRVEQWSPADLPPVPDRRHAPGKRRSFASAVAEVVFGALFLGWWLLVPHYPFLLFGPGALALQGLPFELAPSFNQFYWAVAVLNLVQVVWRAVDLARAQWQYRSHVEHAVVSLLGTIPVILVLMTPGHMYVMLRHGADSPLTQEQMYQLNSVVTFSLVLILAIQGVEFAIHIYRQLRDTYRGKAAAFQRSSRS
jgi:hypothetical protein